MNLQKRLYCSSENEMVGGVCGGIADYLNIDPTLVRLIFVVITLLSFKAGVGLYILLWVLMPAQPEEKTKRKNDEILAVDEQADESAVSLSTLVPEHLPDVQSHRG